MITQNSPLILASGSAVRQQLLKGVGLHFSVLPSGVDEDAIKAEMVGHPIPELAMALAEAKTLSVSRQHPDAYTIGADQICALGDRIFDKPGSYATATEHLQALRGRTHTQHSAVVLAKGDAIVWQLHATAELTMRDLTDREIAAYVEADAPLAACGAYKFESLGRHLFATVTGDHDVIKGIPLLPLLAQLHARGIITMGLTA